MLTSQPFIPSTLNNNGLNLQCVFNIDDLPKGLIAQIRSQVDDLASYRQLILIGHGGKQLWQSMTANNPPANDPIDRFTLSVIDQWLEQFSPSINHHIVYPVDAANNAVVDLMALGELANWHHESPFKVGINTIWGPWFAYRAVVLIDSQFPTTPRLSPLSPCDSCSHKPCINSCPAKACNEYDFELNKCISYRKQDKSKCADTCLAREACPIQTQHRYPRSQINYHYRESLKIIHQYNL